MKLLLIRIIHALLLFILHEYGFLQEPMNELSELSFAREIKMSDPHCGAQMMRRHIRSRGYKVTRDSLHSLDPMHVVARNSYLIQLLDQTLFGT